MEIDSNSDLQTTPPEATRQPVIEIPLIKKNYLLPVGFVIILAMVIAVILLLFNKSNRQKATNSLTESKLNGLSVVYGYQSYSTKTQSWSDSRAFIADLTNTQKIQINPETFANVISPTGKRFLRVAKKTIEAGVGKDPTSFKKIVDVSNRNDILDLGGVVWSGDESQLAYQLFILKSGGGAETQYYTVNFDGVTLQMVGNIPDYSGGHFLGYDFDRKKVYATMNNIKEGQETLIALDTQTNSLENILVLPIDTDILLTRNYEKAYYSDSNGKLTELNLVNKERKMLTQVPYLRPRVRISPDNKLLFITSSLPSGEGGNKFILNLENGSIDTSLEDPKYRELSLYPGYSFSPDSRYVFLFSRKRTIPSDDPKRFISGENSFYSGRYCIWDIINKKIIPFFNCNLETGKFTDEIINEDIGFRGWLQNSEELTLKNNQIPSPTVTVKRSEPDDGLDAFVRTRNIVRKSNVSALVAAIEAYTKVNKRLPQGITSTAQSIAKTGADICSALTSEFIGALPRDPNQGFDPSNEYAKGGYVTDCESDYVTGFMIVNDSGRVTVSAPLTEQVSIISESISFTP